ncbi:MAG: S9 family peptidase [Bacteroidales bacterium]|nr:S9 family peptidase [Bacteroidales bacterium]
MKRLTVALLLCVSMTAMAQLPARYKWTGNNRIAFTQDGSYNDAYTITVKGKKWTRQDGLKFPEKYAEFPMKPEGAVNLTYSPDSTKLAFTRANDLWVADIATGKETRLTFDGTETIMNGYASWVYYEEIFGRPSRYRAFWWSPDSKTLAFYRFDDTEVPMFPIYSPFGQDGALRRTHYPKAGEKNPEVKIGFAGIDGSYIVWADFDPSLDQYFGTPFWSADGKTFYVVREPRIQNTLDLYAVNPSDGSKKAIYHEEVPTWLDWIDGMLFTDKGLYMVRDFETGWQQIYFLSYDGKTLKRLTDGPNWRIALLRADKDGTVYFTAERDSHVRQALYKVSPKGVITALTDTSMDVSRVVFAPDGKHFAAMTSNLATATQLAVYDTRKPSNRYVVGSLPTQEGPAGELVSISVDGLELPGIIYYPAGFDPARKYPVHVDIYGGPDTPMVRDRWVSPLRYKWYWENGIIELIADCRAAGHNGRKGLDAVYKHLNTIEVSDFVEWAKWLQSLPYVRPEKIGVEGFSFGGTMTTMLVATASDYYHYGIAGGGVYDWMLYDSHYTERFMSTPQDNPDGYADSKVIGKIGSYPVKAGEADCSVMLKLTHGTGDDNVHFQNTLQLIDALHRQNASFVFMIYPDGMHGYRGYQDEHFETENKAFWLKYLQSGMTNP